MSGGLLFFSLKPLARMGATVTGVDAVDKNVKIARLHAVRSLTLIVSLIIQITYTVVVYLYCYVKCNCVLHMV